MPGQKNFERKLKEEEKNGVSKNKEFDYETAYLEVVQRRKYSWIVDGERDGNDDDQRKKNETEQKKS